MDDEKAVEMVPVEGHAMAPTTLFGTADPKAIIESATVRAEALADVIRAKKLSNKISGREYVRVEGWTLLGSMLGVFPVCVWTRPIENGWEARVEARTLNGNVVGGAEAQCDRTEDNWGDKPEYALRSMAQTRATSKALRLPLGFIMQLAGYESTPAEEMQGITPKPPADSASASSTGQTYENWDGTRVLKSGRHKGKMWRDLPDKSIKFMASGEFSDGASKDCARAEKKRRESGGASNNSDDPRLLIASEIKKERVARMLTAEEFTGILKHCGCSPGKDYRELALNNELSVLKTVVEEIRAIQPDLDEDTPLID